MYENIVIPTLYKFSFYMLVALGSAQYIIWSVSRLLPFTALQVPQKKLVVKAMIKHS